MNTCSSPMRVWLNNYNRLCNETTGQYLLNQGKADAYNWLIARTGIIPEQPNWSETSQVITNGADVGQLLCMPFGLLMFVLRIFI
ncbi:hypothetical protein LSH36_220g08040 [Paralvinella palmiformis]|uniref:Uncharacterized protein n=1 Tax=Paralvinella palmiformis TaxID=53620 RepID=A0AAD9JQB2_9ANNE|nr:hypothetical protein LSH36_220g08040 [Paralvinella palmiformis]